MKYLYLNCKENRGMLATSNFVVEAIPDVIGGKIRL